MYVYRYVHVKAACLYLHFPIIYVSEDAGTLSKIESIKYVSIIIRCMHMVILSDNWYLRVYIDRNIYYKLY